MFSLFCLPLQAQNICLDIFSDNYYPTARHTITFSQISSFVSGPLLGNIKDKITSDYLVRIETKESKEFPPLKQSIFSWQEFKELVLQAFSEDKLNTPFQKLVQKIKYLKEQAIELYNKDKIKKIDYGILAFMENSIGSRTSDFRVYTGEIELLYNAKREQNEPMFFYVFKNSNGQLIKVPEDQLILFYPIN